jgi:hypothetical protein
VVHLGRFLHEERGSDQVRDDEVVTDFLGGHLPGCRCYRRPVGRGEEPVRRGLTHLLVMLREEGNIPTGRRGRAALPGADRGLLLFPAPGSRARRDDGGQLPALPSRLPGQPRRCGERLSWRR